MMIKRIGVLFLLAFVFSGAWWGKPEPPKVSEPVEAQPMEEAPAVEDPAPVVVPEAPAVVPESPAAVRYEEPKNADVSNTEPKSALRMLTEGDPEARKARLESLVRLSEALRKQKAAQGQPS